MSNISFMIDELRSGKLFQQLRLGVLRLPITLLSLLLLATPLLLLLPSLNLFPYPSSSSQFSDLTISHYPNAIFLKQSIFSFKQIPLWSPTILSGFPFAANPLSGLWYPPWWLVLLTPLPLGLNLLVGIHLIWGGFGLYFLMREEGLGHAASLFSGLAFALLPKVFSHYGAGHLTLLFAISWTPWLLWSQRVYGKARDAKIHLRVPPGIILAMILLADVRWGAFAFILWWTYTIFCIRGKLWKTIKNQSIQSIIGLLLAAPLLIPLVEYSLLSTRAMLGAEDVLVYSLPILNLLGLLFPNSDGLHEWVLYSGGIVLLLAAASLVARKWRRKRLYWMGVFLAGIIIALGSAIPGSSLIANLPLVSLFRVPSRALFLSGFSLAALAGYGIEMLIYSPRKETSRKINIILVLLLGVSISLAVGFLMLQGEIPQAMIWGTIAIGLSVVWIWLGANVNKLPIGLWISGIFIIALLDLGLVDLNSFQGKLKSQVLAEGEAVAQYLSSKPGYFRTYSPSYSIPQQTSVRYGIELADGVDPLQYETYAHYMDEATGVPRDGYSVTVPPFSNGLPKSDNVGYIPNVEKLGLLNVRYIVSEFEIDSLDLKLIKKIQNTYIYENVKFMPRAWMSASGDQSDSFSNVEIIDSSPNRLVLAAAGPGSLTVSEINYPGWTVKVDGVHELVLNRFGLLMGIDLKTGQHVIEFSFCPRSVTLGIGLFVIGLAAIVVGIKRNYRP